MVPDDSDKKVVKTILKTNTDIKCWYKCANSFHANSFRMQIKICIKSYHVRAKTKAMNESDADLMCILRWSEKID
jgi:hypothetical protein